MSLRAALARSFDRWIEQQDEHLVRELCSRRSWLVSTLFVCAFLPVLAYAPGTRGYFGLRFAPALLCYVPSVVGAAIFDWWHGLAKPFGRVAFVWTLVVTSAVQFFCASLIVWCDPRGAAAIASLFIFAAAYYGHVLRVTATTPFLVLGTVLSVVAAVLLDRTGERRELLLFVGVAAITVQLLIGTNARRWALAHRRNEQLRVALTANNLDEQAREMNRLSDTLVEVLGRNHDINNTLMAVRLSADALMMETELQQIPNVGQILGDLRAGLDRLTDLAGDIKSAGQPGSSVPVAEVVDVVAVIDEVLSSVAGRFPGVARKFIVDRAVPLRSPIRGGVVAMRRIAENLIINACEGNGRRGATRIEIKVARDPSGGRLLMVVTDDGPGFSSEQLARGVEVFASTKPNGSGLGLFTCERLVHASDGQIQRANAPSGGAQITVILPLVRT